MNLDELEAKARALRATPTAGNTYAYNAVSDPDTILHLIERARAGEDLYATSAGLVARDDSHGDIDCPQCRFHKARAHWESLTRTPEEA